MKKALILILLLTLCLLPMTAQGETSLRGWVKGQGYQYVLFGDYP